MAGSTDIAEDRARRGVEAEMKARLIQKVLASGAPRQAPGERRETFTSEVDGSEE
jgi:hypothetical protein